MRQTTQNFACWLALGVMLFASLWCCCLPKTFAAPVDADPSLAMSPDHSCCTKASKAEASPTSIPHPTPAQPAPHSSCDCDSHLALPDAQQVYAPITCAAADVPAFDLVMLTATWDQPIVVQSSPTSWQASPPPPADQSLLALSCLLTI